MYVKKLISRVNLFEKKFNLILNRQEDLILVIKELY